MLKCARQSAKLMNPETAPAISICICTFQRPGELSRLLRSLRCLDPSTPAREVIIVDNDVARSAEHVVRQAVAEGQTLSYFVEPTQSIALARTRSVRQARGDWLAFIDDDEEPDPRWLVELWHCVQTGNVDGAFGVVEHCFEVGTPEWIRRSYPAQPRTNARLQWWDTATNNALVRRSAMLALGELFNPAFGLTGGEDSDLFRRMWEHGSVFVGVNSALVRENIPASRATVSYLIRWWLSAGAAGAKISELTKRGEQPDPSRATRLVRALTSGATGMTLFFVSRARGLQYLLASAFESGFLYTQLTGRLIVRYPPKRKIAS
jgi:succinoglycan biosynthesis protein ExoM